MAPSWKCVRWGIACSRCAMKHKGGVKEMMSRLPNRNSGGSSSCGRRWGGSTLRHRRQQEARAGLAAAAGWACLSHGPASNNSGHQDVDHLTTCTQARPHQGKAGQGRSSKRQLGWRQGVSAIRMLITSPPAAKPGQAKHMLQGKHDKEVSQLRRHFEAAGSLPKLAGRRVDKLAGVWGKWQVGSWKGGHTGK